MTLRNRIALTFTLANFAILTVVLVLLYILNRQYTHREFFDRLEDRAHIAAKASLEKEELGPQLLEEINRRHSRTLPQEQEFFFLLDSLQKIVDNTPEYISMELLQQIGRQGLVEFSHGKLLSGVGIRYDDDKGVYAVVVVAQDLYGQRKLQNLLRLMLLFLVLSLAGVFLLSRWYAYHILQPIGRMIREMKKINSTNLNLRLKNEEGRNDELGQLAETFNLMLDRIEAAIEMQNLFIGNASHQLKNPLTAIMGQVEAAMLEKELPRQYQGALEAIGEEADRLNILVRQLIRLSYPDSGDGRQPEWRFDDLIFDLMDEFKEAYPQHPIAIDFGDMPSNEENLVYRGSYQLIRIAISNLLENAIKFSNGEQVKIRAHFTEGKLEVSVFDKGIGIAPEDQLHVFEPFYRAENAKEFPGYGVGLPLVQKIAKMHNGNLRLASRPGEGSVFTLELPF